MFFYYIIEFLVKILVMPFFRLKIYGRKNFIKGSAVVVSNHYTKLDPVIFLTLRYQQMYTLIKKEASKSKTYWMYSWVGLVPIDREGNDINGMKKALKVLKDDKKLIVFPEGTRNKADNEIKEFKGGAFLFAIKAQKPIIPIVYHDRLRFLRRNRLIIGEPFELSEYYGKKLSAEDYEKIAEDMRGKMIELQNGLKGTVKSKSKK